MPPLNNQTAKWKKWVGYACLGIGILLFLMVMNSAILVSSFYYVENWQGARALTESRRVIEARGEKLDPKNYLSGTVPDAQNFGAMTLFRAEPDSDSFASWNAEPLNEALQPIVSRFSHSKEDAESDPDKLPYLEKWTIGEAPDMVLLRSRLMGLCQNNSSPSSLASGSSVADLIDQLCPVLVQLRKENAARPVCIFPYDSTIDPPSKMSYEPYLSLLHLGQVLVYQERIALYEGNSALAMDDLAIGWKVIAGLDKQPSLMASLMAHSISEMQLTVVRQGLYYHNWTAAQLATIDQSLGEIDFLTSGRYAIAGHVVMYDLPSYEYYQRHRQVTPHELRLIRGQAPAVKDGPDYLARLWLWLAPKGWFDLNNAEYLRYRFLGTLELINPAAHRVYPKREAKLLAVYGKVQSHLFPSDPFLFPLSNVSRSVKSIAYCQAQLDEGRIACRLERYHLDHGVYPDSLNGLIPAYGAELPPDVITGKSYRYWFRPDGTFLLYSVGWNGLDDGGKSKRRSGEYLEDAADWVWFSHLAHKK